MRILLIEDDDKIANFVAQGLQVYNYLVERCPDGESGLENAIVNNFDVVLLDYFLPDMNGLEILKELRKSGVDARIIMLTAVDEPQQKVDCLNHGADDYVVKPFHFEELLARIRAISRRNQKDTNLTCADLEMDLLTMEVKRGGVGIELSALEFRLLEFLMQHQGEVITKARLMEHVWGDNYLSNPNKIEVYIHYLRQKVDHEHEVKLLNTLRGKGYMIKAEPASL